MSQLYTPGLGVAQATYAQAMLSAVATDHPDAKSDGNIMFFPQVYGGDGWRYCEGRVVQCVCILVCVCIFGRRLCRVYAFCVCACMRMCANFTLVCLSQTNRQKELFSTIGSLLSAIFIAIAFAIVPTSFVGFIVLEKETKAKHQQIGVCCLLVLF